MLRDVRGGGDCVGRLLLLCRVVMCVTVCEVSMMDFRWSGSRSVMEIPYWQSICFFNNAILTCVGMVVSVCFVCRMLCVMLARSVFSQAWYGERGSGSSDSVGDEVMFASVGGFCGGGVVVFGWGSGVWASCESCCVSGVPFLGVLSCVASGHPTSVAFICLMSSPEHVDMS